MSLKLAIADFSFPKLEWEQSLRLGRDLGIGAVDIGLFVGRSHLRPEDLVADLPRAAARMTTTVKSLGLEVADMFGQAALSAEEKAVNSPQSSERQHAAEFFWRMLELTARCNARHLTILPGVHFQTEQHEDSLKRSFEELSWRVETAQQMGIVLAVEPHIGSVAPTPALARRLVENVPGLTLTLDYSHFTLQGMPDDEVEPLLAFASHFHVRGACKGKLQARFQENTIDFARVLHTMQRIGYGGYLGLEYVWTEWMRCNEVDNLSETILMRDLLLASDRQKP
jgi:sugar phosphate isomerase/epimerase